MAHCYGYRKTDTMINAWPPTFTNFSSLHGNHGNPSHVPELVPWLIPLAPFWSFSLSSNHVLPCISYLITADVGASKQHRNLQHLTLSLSFTLLRVPAILNRKPFSQLAWERLEVRGRECPLGTAVSQWHMGVEDQYFSSLAPKMR